MAKVSLSVTVDNEIINLLDGRGNKSETINTILMRALRTEDGIKAEIEHHKNKIMLLNKELEQLMIRDKQKIENIPDNLKFKLKKVKEIIELKPEKVYVWTEIINKNYAQNINATELRRMIKRWV